MQPTNPHQRYSCDICADVRFVSSNCFPARRVFLSFAGKRNNRGRVRVLHLLFSFREFFVLRPKVLVIGLIAATRSVINIMFGSG